MKEPPSSSALICPQCRAAVGPEAVTCPNCGVNLALAAALAERSVLAGIPPAPTAPYIADLILPRFGDFLLQNGYVTEDQIKEALMRQRAVAAQGQQPTIGQVLLEMGAVTREQLDWASVQQVQQLQATLQEKIRYLEQSMVREQEELRRALQKLGELNDLKANFIATIRHELRTPLSHIKGYREMLARGIYGSLSDDQLGVLDIIGRSTEQLERLISDLLRFTSSAKGEITLALAPASLPDLIRNVLEVSARKAVDGKVQLYADVPEALPRALVDEDKIYWVVFHLVDNAIKFTPEGGEVTVVAAVRDEHVRVSVRDTGIGLPPERMHEIFEPFHQLDGSATRRYGGMGLGLALVRSIVEAHRSQVEVESLEGRGSVFSFEVPIAPL
jgi:signal transduction histidine kinase